MDRLNDARLDWSLEVSVSNLVLITTSLFTPVAKFQWIRLILAPASMHDLELH